MQSIIMLQTLKRLTPPPAVTADPTCDPAPAPAQAAQPVISSRPQLLSAPAYEWPDNFSQISQPITPTTRIHTFRYTYQHPEASANVILFPDLSAGRTYRTTIPAGTSLQGIDTRRGY